MNRNISKIMRILIMLGSLLLAGCQSQMAPISAQEVITNDKVKEWDLLWVSDSSGWGVADIYGKYIEEDLGIKINVMDKWKGGFPAGRMLAALNGEPTNEYDMQKMVEYIEQAEIIVFYGNPERSKSEDNPWDWNCGQGISACYVKNCGMNTFELYINHLEQIYSKIYEIRKGQPTMVRTFDAYNPALVRQCTPESVFDECRACWENYNAAMHQAANEMGVPVANVFDAWNGPDHTEDPNDKGYTQSDKEHPNEKGAAVTAGLLRDLGYEMVIP